MAHGAHRDGGKCSSHLCNCECFYAQSLFILTMTPGVGMGLLGAVSRSRDLLKPNRLLASWYVYLVPMETLLTKDIET